MVKAGRSLVVGNAIQASTAQPNSHHADDDDSLSVVGCVDGGGRADKSFGKEVNVIQPFTHSFVYTLDDGRIQAEAKQ